MTTKDLRDINQEQIPDEINPELEKNVMLYPISKAFLEKFPQYQDINTTYDQAMDLIGEIIKNVQIIDTFISITEDQQVHFRLWMENTRFYTPDSIESMEFSNFGYVPTPNIAIVNRKQYTATMVADIHYEYSFRQIKGDIKSYSDIYHEFQRTNIKLTKSVIKNGYVVNFPIPIGSKYCSLNNYDKNTLMRSGDEMESMYGFFIIDGLFKYLIPIYKKPFNMPIVLKNLYDEQLSRTEIIYTKSFDYENSYFIVGAMVVQKGIAVSKDINHASLPDFGFSLQLQHPKMKTENITESKSKKLINFIPIKFLFYAFGCTNDKEMMSYICPGGDDIGLINAIRLACIQGYKHKEVLEQAKIDLDLDDTNIHYKEPLTRFMARYIIGMIILKDDTIKKIAELLGLEGTNQLTDLERKTKEMTDFRTIIVQTVSAIFNERFMPGAGLLSETNRDTSICIELGNIVRDLYYIGSGLEVSQDKTALTNRRMRHGQQISYEFKSFHGVRLREIVEQVAPLFKERKNLTNIDILLKNKIVDMAKNISIAQSKSLINALKGTSKEQSKIKAEYISFKNYIFLQNLERQIVISSSTKQKGATVSWEHRAVHQSELFFICPTQTPEAGVQTGRFKTPTIYTKLTLGTSGEKEMSYLKQQKEYIANVSYTDRPKTYIIKINGSIVGYVKEFHDVERLYNNLLKARCDNSIENDSSIVLNHKLSQLTIWTDTGRIVSPFVVVKNVCEMKLTSKANSIEITGTINYRPEFINWLLECSVNIYKYDDGLKYGFIEYLDPNMAINNAVIAPTVKDFYMKPHMYTHIALPNHIHGIIAALIPAVNMNVAVRGALSTNFTRQAIGSCVRYPQLKYIDVNILASPQIPLARTCTYDHLRINEYPYGQNIIVAFIQAKYNQEDALILNSASVESGLLQIDSIVNISDEIENKTEEYGIPGDKTTKNGNLAAYNKINPMSALPRNVSELFYHDDPIIGKIRKTVDGEIDISMLNEKLDGKHPITANQRPLRYICKNKIVDDSKQYKVASFGQFRVPIVGDKFNSEYAQKGTVGKILPVDEVPYTSTGLRPDIIFNPPAIIRRRTYGQIYIGILCKIAALLGCPIDTTQYHTLRTDEDLFKILKHLGLEENGYETMYDPDTGRTFESKIFVSNHYWERQSHLVEEKLNIRNGGPRVPETMQPTRGRKNTGGQMIDRMSFDCFIASGAFEMLRDSFLNQGSKIKTGCCRKCGYLLGYHNNLSKEWICQQCGRHDEFTIKEIPPATVLLTHILTGCHIGIDYEDEKPADDGLNIIYKALKEQEKEFNEEEDNN